MYSLVLLMTLCPPAFKTAVKCFNHEQSSCMCIPHDKRGTLTQLEHVIGSAKIPEKHSHRPAIRHGVVRADDKCVLQRHGLILLRHGDQGRMDHWACGQVEGARRSFLEHVCQVLVTHRAHLLHLYLQGQGNS